MLNLPYSEALSIDRSIDILCDLALSHCREAGQPGEELATLIRERRFKELCEYKVSYANGYDVNTMLNIRQALGFFTKLEFLDIGVDKESVARASFVSSEGNCLRVNRLFNTYASGDKEVIPSDVLSLLQRAERKIARVLGPVPDLKDLEFLFGPGATTSVKRRDACARTKLSAVPSCSTNFVPLVEPLMEELPLYCDLHGKYQEDGRFTIPVELHHGKVTFVPKNAKTYRTVMTEPTLNGMVQAAFGRTIASRLLRVGQDISDQSRNQKLAWEGSLQGNLATLDLSSASDSIATELVAFLLPYEWFAALALCRTPTIEFDGQILHLHKFSSMGNGFTFPLQTLIFWALCKVCSEDCDAHGPTSVYGDDIIVPTEAVPLIMRLFAHVGFTINTEKSFWEGPFRESCGADYYHGINIRPFYAKEVVNGALLFRLHNYYYRGLDFNRASRVLGLIAEDSRIFGPDGYGDGHLLGAWTPKPTKRDHGYGGWTFETFTTKPKYHVEVMPGDAVLPAYSVYVRSFAPPDMYGFTAEPHVTPHQKIGEEGDDQWIPKVQTIGSTAYRRIKIYTLSP